MAVAFLPKLRTTGASSFSGDIAQVLLWLWRWPLFKIFHHDQSLHRSAVWASGSQLRKERNPLQELRHDPGSHQ
jgi:hypothetical protein